MTFIRGLMVITVVLLINTALCKDHRCRRPVTENCNASESYINDWENTGWFYDPSLRACLPLYTPEGWHKCTENYDLPQSREICEGLCAEPCTLINGSMGVCMAKRICNVELYNTIIFLDSCGSGSLRCCPHIPDSRLEKFTAPPKDG
ncbi:uncharacterized protein LOC112603279, partial [Melanaphis sacchari]|uniref:uncharacterized protein LOC112603279 n=1 Tax=Melanaphis sacchari TaxID=742174 RepID=UPI000DC13D49